MDFKNFFNESMQLEEDSKFNAGDAMEGIFAIGVALYIADGKIDKTKLNSIRKEVIILPKEPFVKTVDSNIAVDGWIANTLPHIQPNNKLTVKVVINLKNTAKPAFGPDAMPIPNVESSIDQMTNQISQTKAIKRIEQFIIKVLTNNKPDDVTFYVVADGTATKSSKDQIKGDVMLRVEAKTNTPIPQDVEQPVRFSIKTASSTTSNLSIFTAILRLGNFFKLPFTAGLENLSSFPDVGGSRSTEIRNLIAGQFNKQAHDPNHLMYYVREFILAQDKTYLKTDPEAKAAADQKVVEYAWVIINKAIEHLEAQIKNKDSSYDFTNRSFNFLETEIFGSDMAEVIRILPGSISEISKADFDMLRNEYDVELAIVGKDMKFIGVNKQNGTREILFTLSPKIKSTPTEKIMKFDVTIGKLLYKSVGQA